ncbi:hypothetical protein QQ054_06040 [Oscillatoria amoena NRMC-F 0135]|nr:hypothetical protein [Geitlerinema splendidum]MDL5045597.1 hypothetical protein [Oscillatoria amoena NRMC-F 0135]
MERCNGTNCDFSSQLDTLDTLEESYKLAIALFSAQLKNIKQYRSDLQAAQECIQKLVGENTRLQAMNSELLWRVDPYSQNGDPVCNWTE